MTSRLRPATSRPGAARDWMISERLRPTIWLVLVESEEKDELANVLERQWTAAVDQLGNGAALTGNVVVTPPTYL